MNRQIGQNTEYERLRLECMVLKERLANQLELYNHMVSDVAPALASRFMYAVGRLEFRIFELNVEIARWQRRLALVRRAVNRGEQPNLKDIERQVAEEMARFAAELECRRKKVESAAEYLNRKCLSAEDATKMRAAYLDAAKRLHPDINAGLSPEARDLWAKISAAYADRNWRDLIYFSELVDVVLERSSGFTLEGTMEELVARRDRLAELEADRSRKLKEMESRVPWKHKALLDSPGLLRARQEELMSVIVAAKERISEYASLWNEEVGK